MPEVDALFWALKATYGDQCLEDDHGLTIVGRGFIAQLRPGGKVSLRVGEGQPSPAQGWLLGALAEFLAPAGARRDVDGVAVLAGGHILRFGSDGTVRVDALAEGAADGDASEAVGGTVTAPIMVTPTHQVGEWAQVVEGGPAQAPPGSRGWPWPLAIGQSAPAAAVPAALPALPAPAHVDIAEEIAALCAKWAHPLPEGEIPPGARVALFQDIKEARSAVNALIERLYMGELSAAPDRRDHLRALARLDASLRAAVPRISPRSHRTE